MAQTTTGVAQFSKALDDWLTNDVGEGLINFERTDSLTNFINEWADKWRESLMTAKKPKGVGHFASGELYAELLKGWVFTTLGQRVHIQLVLPDYYKYTDDKRNPTSGSGNGALRKALAFGSKGGGWIAQKKLVPSSGMELFGRKLTAAQANKALSFLIARKIHKKGYEGTRWFSKHLKQFETELTDLVEQQFGKGAKFNLQILGK